MELRKGIQKFKRKQKGFTLVELIVVIAIIGVLAGVMLPRYFGFTDDARENACMSEAKTISSICQTYYAEHGVMPSVNEGSLATHSESEITLDGEDTEYTFEGALDFESSGAFTYIKYNGDATENLWIATCDDSGNIDVEKYDDDDDDD